MGDLCLFKALVEKGFDCVTPYKFVVSSTNPRVMDDAIYRSTPLLTIAVHLGHDLNFIKYLVNKGCDVNETCEVGLSRTEDHVIGCAIAVQHDQAIPYLAPKMTRESINLKHPNGTQPFLNLLSSTTMWE